MSAGRSVKRITSVTISANIKGPGLCKLSAENSRPLCEMTLKSLARDWTEQIERIKTAKHGAYIMLEIEREELP